jgi:hypothetical protein
VIAIAGPAVMASQRLPARRALEPGYAAVVIVNQWTKGALALLGHISGSGACRELTFAKIESAPPSHSGNAMKGSGSRKTRFILRRKRPDASLCRDEVHRANRTRFNQSGRRC